MISVSALVLVLFVGRGMLRNVYKGIGQLVHLARNARDPAFVPAEFGAEGSELAQISAALLAMRGDLLSYEKTLVESEARATAANKAKSSFLASMSHEIRTPMVGVAGMLELLAHTKLNSEQREQVEIEHQVRVIGVSGGHAYRPIQVRQRLVLRVGFGFLDAAFDFTNGVQVLRNFGAIACAEVAVQA